MAMFYRPNDGFVGDVIPFYWDGLYHAFYLKAPLPPARAGADGTSYAHLASADLVHWEEWPSVVEPGAPGEPDAVSCWTGSVVEREGVFHLFYTGYAGRGHPQTICHATSRDLRCWQKDARNPILQADPRWYESVDWRDPFVFWNPEQGEWWMLLAARVKDGPTNRRGCIGLAVSTDLEAWEIRPPLWSPRLYYTHECPDLFRWGDRWVLVFSEFSERVVTRYRVSNTLGGPWVAPADDTFDARAFYAAKTASDGQRRFILGWNPTREGETDEGKWEWGGQLVVHELTPMADGAIAVKTLSELKALYSRPVLLSYEPRLGQWEMCHPASFTAVNADGGCAVCTLGEMGNAYQVSLTISCDSTGAACSVLLKARPDLEGYHQLRWEPARRRVLLDRYPRVERDQALLERPVIAGGGGTLRLKIIVEDSVIVAYANDAVALSGRAYGFGGHIGLYAEGGGAVFSDVVVAKIE